MVPNVSIRYENGTVLVPSCLLGYQRFEYEMTCNFETRLCSKSVIVCNINHDVGTNILRCIWYHREQVIVKIGPWCTWANVYQSLWYISLNNWLHYSDALMSTMASQITGVSIFTQPFVQAHIKETSKLRVTGLCERNSPVTGEFLTQRASNAENVSIWWRHHYSLNLSHASILDYKLYSTKYAPRQTSIGDLLDANSKYSVKCLNSQYREFTQLNVKWNIWSENRLDLSELLFSFQCVSWYFGIHQWKGKIVAWKDYPKTLVGYTVHPHPSPHPTHPQPPIFRAGTDILPMYSLYISQRLYSVIVYGECWNWHNDFPRYIQKILTFCSHFHFIL